MNRENYEQIETAPAVSETGVHETSTSLLAEPGEVSKVQARFAPAPGAKASIMFQIVSHAGQSTANSEQDKSDQVDFSLADRSGNVSCSEHINWTRK